MRRCGQFPTLGRTDEAECHEVTQEEVNDAYALNGTDLYDWIQIDCNMFGSAISVKMQENAHDTIEFAELEAYGVPWSDRISVPWNHRVIFDPTSIEMDIDTEEKIEMGSV